MVDTTPPTVNITGGPTGTVPTNTASFPFTAADNPSPNSGTGPVATKCKLDGGAFLPCALLVAVTYNELSDGPHTVTIQGTDQAGNPHSDFRTWTVDTTPPQTTITSDPGAVNPSPDATFASARTSRARPIECSLDGGPWQPCMSPKEYSGLTEGEHNFRVRATDPVGNIDPTPAVHDWADRARPSSASPPRARGSSRARDKPNVKQQRPLPCRTRSSARRASAPARSSRSRARSRSAARPTTSAS